MSEECRAAILSPDLYAMVLRLVRVEPSKGLLGEPHTAHAAFLDLVRRADPELAASLHAGTSRRPFTVSPLWPAPARHSRGSVGDDTWLRVTLLQPVVFTRLRGLFLMPNSGLNMRLGGQVFRPIELVLTKDNAPWAGHACYRELADPPHVGRVMELEFASPTSFSLGQRPWGRKMEPVPMPGAVFDSLWRKWNTFAPASLALGPELLDTVREQVVLSSLSGSTRMIHFPRAPQLGFVGRCGYQVKGHVAEPVLRGINALADFAFYAGVGYKTTMGMGQTRRIGDGRAS